MKINNASKVILLFSFFFICEKSIQAQEKSVENISKIEYAGFEDYYIEFSKNGFNESEQVFKGLVELVELIHVKMYDTLDLKKVVQDTYINDGNEEFSFASKQTLNENFSNFTIKGIDEEYLHSTITQNKEVVQTKFSVYLVLDFNDKQLEFYNTRDLSIGVDAESANDKKEIEDVKIILNNEIIFQRKNKEIIIENTAQMTSVLNEFKIEAEKSNFKFIKNEGRTSIRYNFDF